jgi:hypothetical protein
MKKIIFISLIIFALTSPINANETSNSSILRNYKSLFGV